MGTSTYVCAECGHTAHQWTGRCPSCRAWDTLGAVSASAGSPTPTPMLLSSVDLSKRIAYRTGIGEFDRVLGDGLVAGSVVLLAGEPGVGKSTLTLQAATALESDGARVLLVSGEESAQQVAHRAARIGKLGGLSIIETNDLGDVVAAASNCEVVVVDSIQTTFDPDVDSAPGSVAQVRASAMRLGQLARERNLAVILVGHVTKDGGVAGPKVLEHLVDAVCVFEGDTQGTLRTLRGTKNRFGPAWEVGVFEMNGTGLEEVSDASSRFLQDRRASVPGSAIGCAIEGRRALAFEVQALFSDERGGSVRRVANGIETSRLGVLLAALDRSEKLGLSSRDVYISVPGGLRIADPGADLAVVMALSSAAAGTPLREDTAFFGEVGLGGEVRAVGGAESRIVECLRMGFRKICGPPSAFPAGDISGVEAIPAGDISEAIEASLDPKGLPRATERVVAAR